jgi:hypothetical protein
LAQDWSAAEVAATVADYLAMLSEELRGRPFNKAEHNRGLQQLLNNRSGQAVEFKHANISAVMIELGLPYVEGYKPRGNYQELLRTEVLAQLTGSTDVERIAASVVEAPAGVVENVVDIANVFVDPPTREASRTTYERWITTPVMRQINYLERESHNRSLGRAGELFALDAEHRRLWAAGARRLADKVEHVAATQGDGLGYDIRSFEVDGRERLIEVKTTAFGAMTPFFASANEVAKSEVLATFHLYRVFKFRQAPRIFVLPGSLKQSCTLDPVQFRASVA